MTIIIIIIIIIVAVFSALFFFSSKVDKVENWRISRGEAQRARW